MPLAWRIAKRKHASTAFSGEGASRTGGRWNSRGLRVVYTSGSKSLAALETLVHLNPPVFFSYVIFRIEFAPDLVEELDLTALPRDWQAQPSSPLTRAIGDHWLHEGRSCVLAVPSVIVPEETNYLINPAHANFKKIAVGPAEPFTFDPRLLA